MPQALSLFLFLSLLHLSLSLSLMQIYTSLVRWQESCVSLCTTFALRRLGTIFFSEKNSTEREKFIRRHSCKTGGAKRNIKIVRAAFRPAKKMLRAILFLLLQHFPPNGKVFWRCGAGERGVGESTATADVLVCVEGREERYRDDDRKRSVTGFLFKNSPNIFSLSLTISFILVFEERANKKRGEKWFEWVGGREDTARRDLERLGERKTLPTSTTYCLLTTPHRSGWLAKSKKNKKKKLRNRNEKEKKSIFSYVLHFKEVSRKFASYKQTKYKKFLET